MKRLALQKIDLNMVLNDYSQITNNYYFLSDISHIDKTNLKEIDLELDSILMILGLEGLHFLSKMMRESSDYKEINESVIFEAYCMCDGFGKRTPEELKEINDGWDWSHVRDSSPEAILDAEKFLKQKLVDIYNKR